MKKMTEEEKAINKTAKGLRDSAYNSRRKLYYKARDIADKTFKDSAEYKNRQKFNDDLQANIDERAAVSKALRLKIKELETEGSLQTVALQVKMDVIMAARKLAFTACQELVTKLEAQVETDFLDMVDAKFSASAWKSIEDFTPVKGI